MPENESLPGLDAPAVPTELAQLQSIESLFRGRFPEGYVPLSSPDETSEEADEADETDEEAGETDLADLWNPASELLSIPPGDFIGPLPDSPEIMARLTGFIRRFLACSDDQLTVLAFGCCTPGAIAPSTLALASISILPKRPPAKPSVCNFSMSSVRSLGMRPPLRLQTSFKRPWSSPLPSCSMTVISPSRHQAGSRS